MEDCGNYNVLVTVILEILVGEFFKNADSRNILNEVAALAVTDGDVLYALFCGEESC